MDTSQFGKYLTDEQKLGHYDTLMQEWGKLKDENEMLKPKATAYDDLLIKYNKLQANYQEMFETMRANDFNEIIKLIHDWALIQSRLESFARTYRAPLKLEDI